jgi:hypothetical protein
MDAGKHGRSSDDHLLDDPQVNSTSLQVGLSVASWRTRGTQSAFSLPITSRTIVGFEVAPVAPRSIAYTSSSTAHESFQ